LDLPIDFCFSGSRGSSGSPFFVSDGGERPNVRLPRQVRAGSIRDGRPELFVRNGSDGLLQWSRQRGRRGDDARLSAIGRMLQRIHRADPKPETRHGYAAVA
jgi:hypothetical protein